MFNFIFAICNDLDKKIPINKSFTDTVYQNEATILLINKASKSISYFYDDDFICVLYGSLTNNNQLSDKFLQGENSVEAPELIVKLFKLHGMNCFKHIRGSFSGVLFSIKSKDIYIFKDQVGTKSIYYYQRDKEIIISSHSTCFKNISSLNIEYINAVLNNTPLLGFDTPFKNVKGIPAGHILSINKKGSMNFYFYDDLPREILYKREQEYYEHFLEILEKSIKSQIESHKKIAFTLSGGLDCTLLFAILQRMPEKELLGLTFDLSPYKKSNENQYIELLKQNTRSKIDYVPISKNPYSLISNILLDEPGYYPLTNAWCEIANISHNNNCSAIISGLGGDEITVGFDYLSDITNFANKSINKMIWMLNGMPLSFLKDKTSTTITKQKASNYYIKQQLQYAIPSSRSKYKSLRKMYNKLISGEVGRLIYRYEQDCFEKNNIDLLTPFLDIDLIKYCAALPLSIHAKPGRLKNIHRTVGKNLLPKEIVSRKDKNDFFHWYIIDLLNNKEVILKLLKNSIWINNYNASTDYLDVFNNFERATNTSDFQNSKHLASILMDFVSVELWLVNLFKENSLLANNPVYL